VILGVESLAIHFGGVDALKDVSLDTSILPLPVQIQLVRVPLKFGVLVGEVCYNLRAALDYLVFELAINDSGSVQDQTQFPMESSPGGFAVKRDPMRRECQLRGLSCTHIADIEKLQPYNGCEWTRTLRLISNPDKHRKLTATPSHALSFLHLSRFNPEVFGASPLGPVRRGQGALGEDIYVQFPLHYSIGLADGTPIIPVLHTLKLHVGQALDAFKSDFK